MADDLTTLSELNEKTIVEEIRKRYASKKIYTYIGDILIAINPYEVLPIYGSMNWLKYTDVKNKTDHEPHIYIISDRAYQNMKRTGYNQCCVVSGESGAGKTESTKLMIEHIAQLCKHDESTLHEKIVEVNPLLEAFGNAQTVINNNSSRFGKFIELIFDDSGQILGAKLSEYLLEKSRLVNHGPGERNFHIFYYFFAGLDQSKLKCNMISKPESHRIMVESDGGKVFRDTTHMNECKQTWNVLLNIMKHVGFSSEEVNGIEAVLAAILHISDIKFIPHPETEGVSIEDDAKLALTAQLLQVCAEKFIDALISSSSVVGHETITSMKNEMQASDGRDALAKALYGRMFSWIVLQINNLLAPKKIQNSSQSQNWIGILDIYGFENFKNNSFEQMCINIANEQLQLFFNHHIFKLELEEYAKEGINGSSVVFVDNQPLLDLFLQTSPPGIFALLDEESKFPQASDQTLIDKLVKNMTGKPDFQSTKGQSLFFTIKHFAGPVTYNVDGFLEKNRDTLSDNVINCLKDSNCLIVFELFSPFSEIGSISGTATTRKRNMRMSRLMDGVVFRATPVNSVNQMKRASIVAKKSVMSNQVGTVGKNDQLMRGSKTLATSFKASLCTLIEKMLAAQPHFIRCIKPNAMKQASNFNEKMVTEQLNYTGVLETIKIRKLGYSSRLPFLDFIHRYGVIGGVLTLKNPEQGREISLQIMNKVQMTDWQVGKTKVGGV
ncbi:hypothetical protein HELRODRAFT_170488 [Helobdella robusta]|uniref:Myosin motor domain-containing protein n=1 Tax=Helobdella robusta TaxID=6412 RepID=T1F343_HELRO|nr:hypothetical protein HELRODRAFT_170488 [Helobdella robusta]ESO07178.1 hypothetical protein HELRODRAFT_170488 [Helobdella robusta]